MTAYPYTFHRRTLLGTTPEGGATLQAVSVEAAIDAVEQMDWPRTAVQATIEVTGRADVVITR